MKPHVRQQPCSRLLFTNTGPMPGNSDVVISEPFTMVLLWYKPKIVEKTDTSSMQCCTTKSFQARPSNFGTTIGSVALGFGIRCSNTSASLRLNTDHWDAAGASTLGSSRATCQKLGGYKQMSDAPGCLPSSNWMVRKGLMGRWSALTMTNFAGLSAGKAPKATMSNCSMGERRSTHQALNTGWMMWIMFKPLASKFALQAS
mmetsp:Transcript_97773/g.273683  ORF Transcript_97773/g.273683 Transcript_97773/m.273683 type:complete len:202 (+) Transcript_97773:377-982(+)